MRLNIDFRELERNVRQMGAESITPDLVIDVTLPPLDPIHAELEKGIELDDLSNVLEDPDVGVLTYEGIQVVLYIQDHGWRVQEVIENPEYQYARKFHVCECETLEEMRMKNRFYRYVVTKNKSGDFHITGKSENGENFEGKARLKVCRNCLKKLNYKGGGFGSARRNQIVRTFRLDEFFKEYQTRFKSLPGRWAGSFDGNYKDDWRKTSRRTRRRSRYRCENCGVDLREHPNLLHVHHIDGVKTNNDPSNLKSLCAECHSQEPMHEHMRVSDEDLRKIRRLRRIQKLRSR